MTWMYRSLAVGLAFALGCAAGPDPKQMSHFEDLSRTYIEGFYAYNPSFATSWGFHQFDDSLENWSPEAIRSEEARIRGALKDLETVDPKKLDPATRIDFELFHRGVEGNLFSLVEMRPWEIDPGQYNYGFMLEPMIARSFAPTESRLRSLTSRLRQVGRQLANARVNLKNPPRMFTEFAIGDFEGTISYLQNDVTRAFSSVKDPALRSDFEKAKTEAIAETRSHMKWMHDTLLPASNGSYLLGEDRYRKKLSYEEMIDVPLDTLLAVGEREMARLDARYQAAAKRIDPSKPVAEIVAMMRQDHPPADSLLDYARGLLEGIRSFCIESKFIAIPSEVRCQVRPTPEYAASRSFASFDGPGPLETKATEAFYNITLPGKTWPKDRVEQFLQGYNRWTLPSTSIHEVYPGHYTHFLYAKNSPTFVRKAFGAGSFAEGWGLYTEEAVLNHGYGNGDPKIEFGVMRWALIRACRLQVGIRLHTRGMTMEEGVRYFMDHAGLERVNAEREAGRAAFDPTYSIYTLGALEIRKLRDDVAREQGKKFDLAQFHATILSQGALPVALLRRMLLRSEGSIL
ncbi:MAG: DUF885 domain-containing protein [Candidatus Eisenbacteria bacterium]|uniref:DUF885 domain-containing protein n=1 Tax=Eiseniibacteriota bacterium TaxID=2212470 RepID=A0A538TI67_UNCEI|nr:MAG: DUF885 domain-containing protein [Candidatus Eisenbacteria bacterium]